MHMAISCIAAHVLQIIFLVLVLVIVLVLLLALVFAFAVVVIVVNAIASAAANDAIWIFTATFAGVASLIDHDTVAVFSNGERRALRHGCTYLILQRCCHGRLSRFVTTCRRRALFLAFCIALDLFHCLSWNMRGESQVRATVTRFACLEIIH